MTNNPTIDGVSRKLLKELLHFAPDGLATELQALLDTPAVERQEPVAPFYISVDDWNLLVRGDVEIASVRISRTRRSKFTESLFAHPSALQSTIAQLQARLQGLESSQVMGRIHHTENGVVCALNSIGLQLPDDTRLFAHPAEPNERGTVGETPQESRTAWIAVVLQKCPEASINVAGHAAEARATNGIAIGHWTPEVWSVK